MTIIISRALGLGRPASAGFTDDNPLIGWRNVVTTASLAADGEDANNPAVNLANPSTFSKWIAAAAAEQFLTVTVPEGGQVDYVGVARHNFGSAQIPVSVETRAEAADDWVEVVPPALLADDAPVILAFEPQEVGHVRLRMGAGIVPPQAAVMHAGVLLVSQRRVYVSHTPLPMGRVRNVRNGRSESGNFLGRIVTGQKLESSVELRRLTPVWVRRHLDPFLEAGANTPFFFAWRPASYPRETGYAWLTNDPRPENTGPAGLMAVTLQFGGTVA